MRRPWLRLACTATQQYCPLRSPFASTGLGVGDDERRTHSMTVSRSASLFSVPLPRPVRARWLGIYAMYSKRRGHSLSILHSRRTALSLPSTATCAPHAAYQSQQQTLTFFCNQTAASTLLLCYSHTSQFFSHVFLPALKTLPLQARERLHFLLTTSAPLSLSWFSLYLFAWLILFDFVHLTHILLLFSIILTLPVSIFNQPKH